MISIPCADSAAEAPLSDGSWQISLTETSSVDPVDDHCDLTSTTMLRAERSLTIVESGFNAIRLNMPTQVMILSRMSCDQCQRTFHQLIPRFLHADIRV